MLNSIIKIHKHNMAGEIDKIKSDYKTRIENDMEEVLKEMYQNMSMTIILEKIQDVEDIYYRERLYKILISELTKELFVCKAKEV